MQKNSEERLWVVDPCPSFSQYGTPWHGRCHTERSGHHIELGQWLVQRVYSSESLQCVCRCINTTVLKIQATPMKAKPSSVSAHSHAHPLTAFNPGSYWAMLSVFIMLSLWECSVNGITCYLTFSGWLFFHSALTIHPCCGSYQSFTPAHCRVNFHGRGGCTVRSTTYLLKDLTVLSAFGYYK